MMQLMETLVVLGAVEETVNVEEANFLTGKAENERPDCLQRTRQRNRRAQRSNQPNCNRDRKRYQ